MNGSWGETCPKSNFTPTLPEAVQQQKVFDFCFRPLDTARRGWTMEGSVVDPIHITCACKAPWWVETGSEPAI